MDRSSQASYGQFTLHQDMGTYVGTYDFRFHNLVYEKRSKKIIKVNMIYLNRLLQRDEISFIIYII